MGSTIGRIADENPAPPLRLKRVTVHHCRPHDDETPTSKRQKKWPKKLKNSILVLARYESYSVMTRMSTGSYNTAHAISTTVGRANLESFRASCAVGSDLLIDVAATDRALLELSRAHHAAAVVPTGDQSAIDLLVQAHLGAD